MCRSTRYCHRDGQNRFGGSISQGDYHGGANWCNRAECYVNHCSPSCQCRDIEQSIPNSAYKTHDCTRPLSLLGRSHYCAKNRYTPQTTIAQDQSQPRVSYSRKRSRVVSCRFRYVTPSTSFAFVTSRRTRYGAVGSDSPFRGVVLPPERRCASTTTHNNGQPRPGA